MTNDWSTNFSRTGAGFNQKQSLRVAARVVVTAMEIKCLGVGQKKIGGTQFCNLRKKAFEKAKHQSRLNKAARILPRTKCDRDIMTLRGILLFSLTAIRNPFSVL